MVTKKARVAVQRVALGILALLVIALAAGFHSDRDAAALEARYATPPSKFVDVDGLRVHYRDRGKGPAMVLVHGSPSSLGVWEGWAEALSVDHRVVTFDMPGHGLTGPDPKGRYTAAEIADLVDAFATAIGLDRFVIGGNSAGGNVAWHYAILHGGRIDGLLLVDAAGLPRLEPRPVGLRLMASPILGPITRWVTPRFIVASSLRSTYGDPSRVSEELVDRTYDMLLRDGNRAATRERLRKGDDDMWTRLSEIHVPTLILWGSRDKWILPKYGDQLRDAIPGAKLVTLEGLGHMPMEEDPVASMVPVREWLRESVRAQR
jgi:pimeloyl-ACP methyl ester carboxylesterase